MSWDLSSDRPIYAQLLEQIELKICSGIYPPGFKMPSVRDLAQEASVNPNTMQRALSALEDTGLLYSHRTSGRFVTDDADLIKNTRTRLAQKHIKEFLKKMSELGFNKGEILEILINLSGGNTK
ncbi:MAG TPA: GntR family transcriptional regulator [Eubacteriaceae bacterium]|jgi:GntR family transcriptional regulator|nr:GntR family transcriptional regulator [Eubacteriaceae bacterium]